jgi:ATP-dependent Clp protease ATP-binding subunit ClpC
MTLANDEAARLGHGEIGTGHVLLGLIRGGGVAGHVLAEAGIDAQSIEDLFAEPEVTPGTADVALADLATASRQEATWLGHNYPGTEHLLLGLCTLADCQAVRMLLKAGVRPRELCHEVLDILGHFDAWDRWANDHPDVP